MYKILIVDDEPDVCESISNFLTKRGHDVEVAHSAEEALEKISQKVPDLVLLDIYMPGMGGIEGLKKIKEINPSIAVIMVTASDSARTSDETMRMGASGYIAKPVTTATLEKLINITMRMEEAKRQLNSESENETDA